MRARLLSSGVISTSDRRGATLVPLLESDMALVGTDEPPSDQHFRLWLGTPDADPKMGGTFESVSQTMRYWPSDSPCVSGILTPAGGPSMPFEDGGDSVGQHVRGLIEQDGSVLITQADVHWKSADRSRNKKLRKVGTKREL